MTNLSLHIYLLERKLKMYCTFPILAPTCTLVVHKNTIVFISSWRWGAGVVALIGSYKLLGVPTDEDAIFLAFHFLIALSLARNLSSPLSESSR